MDALLKALADASLEVSAAEESLDEGAFHTAEERLDNCAVQLDALRAAWPGMSSAERGVVGPGARAVRERLDAARPRVPKLSALTVGAAVHDPEEETEPE